MYMLVVYCCVLYSHCCLSMYARYPGGRRLHTKIYNTIYDYTYIYIYTYICIYIMQLKVNPKLILILM